MRQIRILFDKIENWFAPKKRRYSTLAAIAMLAAFVSVASTINSYSINSFKPPAGVVAWFASSSLGAHEVDPQYSQACVAHDHYYPVGMPIDQSGWPLSFEYDVFTARFDCQGIFYPVLFVIDLALFAATYAMLLFTLSIIITKLRHNKHITGKRVLFAIVAYVISVFVTYGTAYRIHITTPDAQAPPVLSAVITSSYVMPVSLPLCPSGNSIVENEICHATGVCTLTGISEPSDPRYAVQGWPLAYIYNSLDPCFGNTIYPLIFVMDTTFYFALITAAGVIIMHMKMQGVLGGIHRI